MDKHVVAQRVPPGHESDTTNIMSSSLKRG